MFKKSLIAVMLFVLFVVMAGTPVFAAEKAAMSPEIARALADIEQVNNEIYTEIAKAQVKADEIYGKYQADFANEQDAEKQAALTSKYNEKLDKLISKLDEKTQKMTSKGVEKATAAGITVEVEWILCQFADRYALIDPLVVIDW
ncbi:hypothetical protein SAMN04487975_101253 [Planococcus glaciei]|uniref:hypothetical protein n=1 Tax=Planococcus glaciei TaxID=459472 RepID=UPI00088B8823|nr:hypothetical protein [Planococcus glaciei]SDG71009.1 hypothetical protein SAMN04487975_101253 [Planococcus glaciei]